MASPTRSRSGSPQTTSIPQKRLHEEDHAPAVSSPLNPDARGKPAKNVVHREQREKKESLKKREAKGADRVTPDPKTKNKSKSPAQSGPLRYRLPPPRPTDYQSPRGPVFLPHGTVYNGVLSREEEIYETSEHVYNRKGFRYTPCVADPAFPYILQYRQSETEPYEACFNLEDTASHLYFDHACRKVQTDKGFRMARANVCVREGRWFWECKVLTGASTQSSDSLAHVRLGWARREASLDAPVGFDAYSYGIRDVQGQKLHMSRPKNFFPDGESILEGDVIGLEINLPSIQMHRRIVEGSYNPAVDLKDEVLSIEGPDIVRDRLPIRYKSHLYFEQFEYQPNKELEDLMNPSPVVTVQKDSYAHTQSPNPTHPIVALRTLPSSYIRIFKNGKLMGEPFQNLLAFLPPASKPITQVGAREGMDDGMLGYFPAVSVFRGGMVETNFGPNLWFPPPDDGQGEIRPMCERYDEQIVMDIVFDLVDEVDFWMQDADKHGASEATLSISSDPVVEPRAAGEIREIVQED